jgi:hypothetical protein
MDKKSKNCDVQITFDNILAFRETNESFALKTIAFLYEQGREEKGFDANAWIFVSQKTQFMEWLHAETDNIYKDHKIKHFMIVSSESITDVLTFDDPVIKCQR